MQFDKLANFGLEDELLDKVDTLADVDAPELVDVFACGPLDLCDAAL